MREEDKLHFSPKYTFGEIDFEDEEKLIDAFRDRVYGFYLRSAELVDKEQLGFACGLLCVATIDLLARFALPNENVGKRIEKWLKENVCEFEDYLAKRFYEDFRCGLVHEGRIKNLGEFSYDSKEIVDRRNGVVIVNPGVLLKRIGKIFEDYLSLLEKDHEILESFKNQLKRDFENEVKREGHLREQ